MQVNDLLGDDLSAAGLLLDDFLEFGGGTPSDDTGAAARYLGPSPPPSGDHHHPGVYKPRGHPRAWNPSAGGVNNGGHAGQTHFGQPQQEQQLLAANAAIRPGAVAAAAAGHHHAGGWSADGSHHMYGQGMAHAAMRGGGHMHVSSQCDDDQRARLAMHHQQSSPAGHKLSPHHMTAHHQQQQTRMQHNMEYAAYQRSGTGDVHFVKQDMLQPGSHSHHGHGGYATSRHQGMDPMGKTMHHEHPHHGSGVSGDGSYSNPLDAQLDAQLDALLGSMDPHAMLEPGSGGSGGMSMDSGGPVKQPGWNRHVADPMARYAGQEVYMGHQPGRGGSDMGYR